MTEGGGDELRAANARLQDEVERLRAELAMAREQQAATAEILRVIASSPDDAQPVLDTIVRRATILCDAIFADVFLSDGEQLMLAAHNFGPELAEKITGQYPRPIDRSSIPGQVILDNAVSHLPDALNGPGLTPRLVQAAKALGVRSALTAPMVRDGRAVGAIGAVRGIGGPFSASQIELLKTFADQAAIALENVRLFKALDARTAELSRTIAELRALEEIGRAVSSTLDLDTVLRTIVSRTNELAGTDGCSIYEYDAELEEFHQRANVNLLQTAPADLPRTLGLGEGAVGRLAQTLTPVQVPDIQARGAYHGRLRDALLAQGFRAILAVPLLCDDRLLGGLVVSRATPGAFSDELVDLLQTFATQSAIAIRNARLFREIDDKNRQLEVASRHKSEFLAHMSHELRTPMNGVIGMAELALGTELTEVQRDYLTTVKVSAESLLSLINDILDVSKIEAGRLELEAVPFSLRQTVDLVVKSLAHPARQKGLTLAASLAPGVPDGVVGDPGRLRQVLVNLVGNALKFTAQGGITVSVAEERGDAAPAPLHIAVTDTGIGIAPEHQAKVFEAFTQADASTARRFGGTGLGLTISSQLVRMMGGRIWVESEPGRGSTFHFTVRLPRAAAPVASEAVADPSRPAARTTARPRRVLLAEDSVPNQKVARGFLERWGHTVEVAGNGRAALAALERAAFDLVLMDVHMPEMDGFEATAAIRAREGAGARIPIIAMTADAMQGDRERCLAAGMDGYVTKPVVPTDLFDAIERTV
ncbi:MAG: GAF domain-containing protein [Candidatus Rokubacteria bacterium]|nr:GAF domain-containing protein [Candidatus Rokubacteria bacterium]